MSQSTLAEFISATFDKTDSDSEHTGTASATANGASITLTAVGYDSDDSSCDATTTNTLKITFRKNTTFSYSEQNNSGSLDSATNSINANLEAGKEYTALEGDTITFVISAEKSKTTEVVLTFAMEEAVIDKPDDGATYLLKNGDGTVYYYLDEAITAATNSTSNKTIVVASNGTVYHSSYKNFADKSQYSQDQEYTIPSGVTLLVPYNAEMTVCTETPTFDDDAYTTPSVFRTLKLDGKAKIIVNGAISVSGKQSSKYDYNGSPSGPLGFINMASESNITVNNGGKLYVWGYITGEGGVTANSGSQVYECFQIADYRGGDVTTTMNSSADTYGVFPFNQYYLQNVEVPMSIYAGATLNGISSVSVTLSGTQKMSVPFIGGSTSMFYLESGYLVKDYLEGTGRTSLILDGQLNINEISITTKVNMGGSITINTAKYVLPIPNHMSIYIEDKSTINLNQNVALCPGSELYVRAGGTCTLGSGKSLYIYDYDQWTYTDGNGSVCGYAGTTNALYDNLKYVPGGDSSTGKTKDAMVQVNGTLDASLGNLYVTGSGANICSTGAGQVKVKTTTGTTIRQVITEHTSVTSWPEIAMQPAILQNADGSDVNTNAETGTYTYYASTGRWDKPSHFYGDPVVTEPTCDTPGSTSKTCEVCDDRHTEEVAATGHTVVVDAAVAATCTTTGLTEGSHCSVCNEVLVKQETVAAKGHTFGDTVAAKAATCEEAGNNAHKQCTACNLYFAGDAVTTATDGKTDATSFATAQLEHSYTGAFTSNGDGKESTHSRMCVNGCNEYGDAVKHIWNEGEVTTEPGCTTAGIKTYTCTAKDCGATYTEDIVVAMVDETPHTILQDALEDASAKKTTVILMANVAGDENEEIPVSLDVTVEKGEHTANIVAGAGYEALPEDTTMTIRQMITLSCLNLDIEGEILLNLKFNLPDWFLNTEGAYVYVHEADPGINPKEDRQWYVSVETLKSVPEYNAETNTNGLLTTWTFGEAEVQENGHIERDDQGRYVFSQGIAAGEMSGDVTVTFYVNGQPVNVYVKLTGNKEESVSRSVFDYAQLAIEKGAADSATEKEKALKSMCEAMLTYGYYAQQFFTLAEGYTRLDPTQFTLGNLDVNLDEVAPTFSLPDSFQTTVAAINSIMLNLDSTIDLRIYLTPVAEISKIEVSRPYLYGTGYTEYEELPGTLAANAQSIINTSNVPPAYWNNAYMLKFGDSTVVTCSVLDWIIVCLNTEGGSDAEQNMAKAMYHYCLAADEYFAIKYGNET